LLVAGYALVKCRELRKDQWKPRDLVSCRPSTTWDFLRRGSGNEEEHQEGAAMASPGNDAGPPRRQSERRPQKAILVGRE
jgi:hypothetical protein